MKAPDVKTILVDEANNTTYHIMAYRQLTHAEAERTVRASSGRRKRLPKNKTITIVTALR